MVKMLWLSISLLFYYGWVGGWVAFVEWKVRLTKLANLGLAWQLGVHIHMQSTHPTRIVVSLAGTTLTWLTGKRRPTATSTVRANISLAVLGALAQ